jgi:cysteine-rich repeat protein
LIWFSFAANCGDGRVYGNETCDDFVNTGNGCLTCQVVPGWTCPDNGTQSLCVRMLHRITEIMYPSLCSLVAICGDGLILGSEECDDGRRPPSSGDGCSESCKNESGFSCPYDSVNLKSVCTRMAFESSLTSLILTFSSVISSHQLAICGDGVVISPETCDDFNSSNGCLVCRIVDGWSCPYVGNQSICTGTIAITFHLFLLFYCF